LGGECGDAVRNEHRHPPDCRPQACFRIVANIQQQADFNTYWQPVLKSEFTAIVDGISGGTDPDAWLYERFHTGGGQNFWLYSNPEVDKLLEQGRQETDQAKRKAIYDQAQTIIANDAPVVFLYNVKQTEAWRDYVKGYVHNSTITLLNLKKTWLAK
jgi:peptide/nickel transport system substrate-binding protein